MHGIVLILLFLVHTGIKGQDHRTPSLFDSLYSLSDVQINLTYPYDSLYKTKREEIPARITLRSGSRPILEEEDITVNIRGKFRRMHCEVPPLMLNFRKTTLRQMQLSTADEIKLVTHCIEGEAGQVNLQEELLCYQLYAALTAQAYRTIWVTVTYSDATNPGLHHTSAGILLEPDKVLEERLGLEERKAYNMAGDSIDFNSYSRVVAYNFLIGNRDCSISSSRNAKLFYDATQKKYIVIPYDFDYANIVGASYRKERLPASMDHPFDRLYDGEYFPDKAGEILQTFIATQTGLMQALETAPNAMSPQRRSQIRKYLEQWYGQLQRLDPAKMKYGLVCPYKGGL